jgi:hypothetical protein
MKSILTAEIEDETTETSLWPLKDNNPKISYGLYIANQYAENPYLRN